MITWWHEHLVVLSLHSQYKTKHDLSDNDIVKKYTITPEVTFL